MRSVEIFDSENPDKGWKKSGQFSLPVKYSDASSYGYVTDVGIIRFLIPYIKSLIRR